MTQTLIRLFRDIGQAQQAHAALLAGGFDPGDVQLDASEDEAGTVAGNFVLPRKEGPDGRASGVDEADEPPGNRSPDAANSPNSQAVTRGQYILTVAAAGTEAAALAQEIVERYGALDPTSRH